MKLPFIYDFLYAIKDFIIISTIFSNGTAIIMPKIPNNSPKIATDSKTIIGWVFMVLLYTLGTKKFPSKNCNTIIIIRIINTFDGLETMVKITTIAPPIYGPI